MTDFKAGFASRHHAGRLLQQAFAPASGFEAADPRERAAGSPRSFAPQGPGGPRHFSPLDPNGDPTAGWNPLDPNASQPESGGFVDPIAAAHKAGHGEGYAAGLAQAAIDSGRDRALAEGIARAMVGGDRLDREGVARQLRETVLALVGRLVGEVGVAGDLLAGRIEASVELLADSAESALLRLHPDDVALVEGKLPKTLFPIGDAAVERGGFVLESASTIVEDGPSRWLEQLAQAIERVAVPK